LIYGYLSIVFFYLGVPPRTQIKKEKTIQLNTKNPMGHKKIPINTSLTGTFLLEIEINPIDYQLLV
jgi:hypothetical protein